MKRALFLIIVSLIVCGTAIADEQSKAEKQLNRISAMAFDSTARKVVSVTISDTLSVKRPELVEQRRATGLNYGSLYLARLLMAGGMDPKELSDQLKGGKSIIQIANDRHVDWKQIQNDAKKLNGKIEKRLYEHFVDTKEDNARDKEDNYNVAIDSVKADTQVPREDIDNAADTYDRLRGVASQRAGNTGAQSINTADSLTFRRDHAREGAPDPSTVGSATSAPR